MEERTSVHRPIGAPPRKRLTFTYDHRHRRVAKTVHEWDAATSSFTRLVKSLRFVYDDWNMIAELDATACPATGLAGSRLARTFVWGSDISAQAASPFSHASNQGAGGVGGLLAVNHQGTSYFPCADANGNTMGLFNASSGTLTARYDYSPFGERITDTGPAKHGGGKIEISPFGFSTKYVDEETSLVYYGFRYYSPELGRWLSRDPIGERGGENLYAMVGNNPINWIDGLGLETQPGWGSGGASQGNCWRYSCSDPAKPLEHHNRTPPGWDNNKKGNTCKKLMDAIIKAGGKTAGNGACPKCYQKIAVMISNNGAAKGANQNGEDFHFMLYDPNDDTWSQKAGSGAASNRDKDGNPITDPSAQRNKDVYNHYCGELCVPTGFDTDKIGGVPSQPPIILPAR